ncbi:prephenate dehydrogenase [Bacillus sp. HMF5848]|uniref:prephenate dehydrogenase n=1 Tax=Bacillus sp. HMF5848 TaxID=2495421 RepID=UPI000F7B031D|nr:prephenate dehydrogenase [Bacillus sp. HMF5848]RSK29343.1 prephenate dehydrogenase [Bacillus sp. HMF5848]
MSKKVFVIGLGLIGGSVALAIRREHQDVTIVGYDVNGEQLQLARTLAVIDEIAESIEDGSKESDLIIIATPVQQAVDIIHRIASLPTKSGVIVTDVGSTKKHITESAQVLLKNNICFIGGHPMAGSHKNGVAAARAHLFENAFYIFTPTTNVDNSKIIELKNWLAGTKARFITLSPEEHDRIAGVISHFPHIIAAGLVHQAEKLERDNELVSRLAAGGFRDITRIASSNPTMWRDIFLHNRNALLQLFDGWLDEMRMLRSIVETGDSQKIYEYFLHAKEFRDGLPVKEKGAIPSFYDLFVDVPDKPGAISEITGYLAENKISITNIRILETREDILGVLRLSFQTDSDRKRAKQCIEANSSYETYYA